jgi:hypothetical protein
MIYSKIINLFATYSCKELPIDISEPIEVHNWRVFGDGDQEHLDLALCTSVY